MALSKRRQRELSGEESAAEVRYLHGEAVRQFGQSAVDKDLTRLWDVRCMLGMQRILPFGGLTFTNLGEMMWIAENVCGYKRHE